VCGLLPSKVLGTICGIVCEILGIEEFAKLLNEIDVRKKEKKRENDSLFIFVVCCCLLFVVYCCFFLLLCLLFYPTPDFSHLFQPDPIYICEKVDFCPHSTTAAANITSLTVTPAKGPQGTTFDIEFIYTVTSAIATGLLISLISLSSLISPH